MNEDKSPSKLRVFLSTLIVICVLYFVIGSIAVLIGWFDVKYYAIAGGVVGGLASVLGLFSLARPSLSQQDIEQIEVQSLKSIAEMSGKIKELELAKNVTREQLDSLEEQKEQMELLVRKASLSLFLQEQNRLYEKKIIEQVNQNKELQSYLSELASTNEKLEALNEEINSDPNVRLLQEIIESAQKKPEPIKIDFKDYPLVTRTMLLLARDTIKIVQKVLRPI